MKQTAHVGMTRKAAIESDVNECYRRVFQQFLCSLQLQVEQVVVWAVPCRCLKHTDEMDPAVTTLVRKRLKAEVSVEIVHALDHSAQHVLRQSGCVASIGFKPCLLALVKHS